VATPFVVWLLHHRGRERLLSVMPPIHPRVVAHHVTLRAEPPKGFPLPAETEGFVEGFADGGADVQAPVVGFGGTTKRPDGSAPYVT
jgi:hypothetical protein